MKTTTIKKAMVKQLPNRYVALLTIASFIFLFNLVSAEIYSDCSIYGNCKPIVTQTQTTSTGSGNASTGNCPVGYVVQNTTTSGVQCVSVAGGSMDYPYVNTNINENLTVANTYTNSVNNSLAIFINNVYLKIADMFTKSEIVNMISGNRTSISSYPISNITGIPSCTSTQVLTNRTGSLSCVEDQTGGSSTPTISTENWVISQDFLNPSASVLDPFLGTAVSSGTLNTISADALHPGIVALRDSTTANGGFLIRTDPNAFLISGGENITLIFRQNTLRNNATYRMGFIDTSTIAAPTDGCYFEVNTINNSLVGRCATAGVNYTTASSILITNAQWYTATMEVNASATGVHFRLFNYLNAPVWNDSLAVGIPTAAGRETGFGIIATDNSTDSGNDIVQIDYVKLQIMNRSVLQRQIYNSNATVKFSNDFLTASASVLDPFLGTAINVGFIANANSESLHPGVIEINDSTTANGGYSILDAPTSHLISGGESAIFIFNQKYYGRNGTTYRMGFLDTTTSAEPTDGCYFQINATRISGNVFNNQTLWGVCSTNSVRTFTPTNWTILNNTWLIANMTINNLASSVNFSVYNETNSILWSNVITTNIPTAAGRETGFGAIGTEATTDTNKSIVQLDYMSWTQNLAVLR